MTMPDGNSAALRAHEADQDRLERQAPTEDELERYVEDWMDDKQRKMGFEFISEAVSEATDDRFANLYAAYRSADSMQIGIAVKATVAGYWRPMAEKAAESHNFEEDRHECYAEDGCVYR